MAIERVRVAPPRPWWLPGLAAIFLAGCGGGGLTSDAPAAPQAPALQGAVALPQVVAALPAPATAPDAAAPLVIWRQPRDVEARAGSIVLLDVGVEVAAGRVPALSYQWLRDGAPIDGETGPSLQLVLMPVDHLARISVRVRAGRDTLTSDAAVLRIGRL